MTYSNWLSSYAGVSLGTPGLTARLERRLTRRALTARASPAARDRLFVQLSGTIARWVRPYAARDLAPWEFDDVVQESYLAFVDVLERWSERVRVGPGGRVEPGFTRYFLRTYPYLLANRVDALLGRSHAHLLAGTLPAGHDRPDPWVAEAEVRATLLLDLICARLPARDAQTLRQAAAAGFSIPTLARQTGVPPRTLYHRWARITATARAIVLGRSAA